MKNFSLSGVNQNGKSIIEINVVNPMGNLATEKGIVADRVRTANGTSRIDGEDEWWSND
ncbi:MAG: hypothetical protein IPP79_22555 [Chitinophagaceae bacterium]|nr:hypothetical protein [Chitinophagaceae bacterium]